MKTSFFLFAATMTAAHGFAFDMFSAFKPNSVLSEVTESKMGEKFTVRMDIGQGQETHMNLDGLTIELLSDRAAKDQKIGLPGADGPHPKTSSGALALKVHETPYFIDLFGTQKVRFEKPCYELIWKKDNYRGSLICGFNLPAGATRNGANLPAGRLYLSFPIWSQEGLAVRQAEKFEVEARVKEYTQERDEAFQKYVEEKNVLRKAWHYRNAAAAVEKIDFSGIRMLSQIPSPEDGGIATIGNGLMLQTDGSVWTKEDSFLGAKHTQLGEAFLTPVVQEAAESVLRP